MMLTSSAISRHTRVHYMHDSFKLTSKISKSHQDCDDVIAKDAHEREEELRAEDAGVPCRLRAPPFYAHVVCEQCGRLCDEQNSNYKKVQQNC